MKKIKSPINAEFSRTSNNLTAGNKQLYSPEQLEAEFHMPGFAKAYNEGTRQRFIPPTADGTKVVITLDPYNLPVPEPLSRFTGQDEEKGLRLFIDVKEGQEEPYRMALFFEERADGKLAHNGVILGREEDGGIKFPKMVDVTMKALGKRLFGYQSTENNFKNNNTPHL